MRTAAKRLALRRATVRRRRALLDAVRSSRLHTWHDVERAAADVGDPAAMELAGVIAVLMGQLFERAVDLVNDCEVGA